MSAGSGGRFGLLKTAAFNGVAYAAGSIPTGRLVTRALTGQRLQDLGDGKAGSSNVARSACQPPSSSRAGRAVRSRGNKLERA